MTDAFAAQNEYMDDTRGSLHSLSASEWETLESILWVFALVPQMPERLAAVMAARGQLNARERILDLATTVHVHMGLDLGG